MESKIESSKIRFIDKITPFIVGLYVFLVFFGVFGASKVFGETSQIVTIVKGAIFIVFFAYTLLAGYLKKINLNRYLVIFLTITLISSFISILSAPSSKSILSVGRAWMEIENYYTGWQHSVSIENVSLNFMARITALIDAVLFASCIVIYAIILPKLLNTRKSISKTLFNVSLVVVLSALLCYVLDKATIINIIKNPTSQTALKSGVKSIFTNKNTFGLVLFAGALAANLSTKMDSTSTPRKIIMILSQIIIFGTTVISLCKTAIVLLFIYYFSSLIYRLIVTKKLTKTLKITTFSVIGFFGLLAILFIFVPSFAAIFGDKVYALQQKIYFLFINYGTETISSRTEAWAAVFQTVNGESIFFGLGDKIFEEYYAKATYAVRYWGIVEYHSTHNSLLAIYLQGGLIRLISYVALLVYLYQVVIKIMKKNSKTGFYSLLILIVFTTYSMIEAVLFGFHDTISLIINLLCLTIPLSFYESYSLAKANNEQVIEIFNVKNVFAGIFLKFKRRISHFKTLTNNEKNNAGPMLFSFIFTTLMLIATTFAGYQLYARNILPGIFFTLSTIVFLYLSVRLYKQWGNKENKINVLLFTMCCYIAAGIFIRINNLITPLNIYNGYISKDSIVELEWKGLYNHYHTGYLPLLFVLIASVTMYIGITKEINFAKIFEKKEKKQSLLTPFININHYEPMRTKENMKVLVLAHNALANENANAVVLSNMLTHFDDSQIAQIFIKNDVPTRFIHSKFYKITDMLRLKGFFSKKTHGEIVNAEEEKEINISKAKKRSKLASFLSTSALGELIREFIWKYGKFDYSHLYSWINDFNPDVILFVPSRSVFLNDLTLKIAKDLNLPVMLFTTEDEYFHEKKKINFFHNIMLKKLRKSYHRVNEYVANMVLIQDRLKQMYESEFKKPCETIMMSSKNHVSSKPYDEKLLLYAGNVDRGRISTLITISKTLEKINTSLKLTVIPGGATEAQLSPLKERKNVKVLEFLPYSEYIKYLESAYVLFNVDTFEKRYSKITKETFTGKTADLLRMGRPLCVIAPKYMYTYEYYIHYPNCAEVCGDLNNLEQSLRKVIYNNKYRRTIARNAYELSIKNHDLNSNAEKFKDALYRAYLEGENMRKIKILQINATYDFRSTGRIMADIHKQLLKDERFDPYVIYGRGQKSSDKNVYKVVGNNYAKTMNVLSRFTGVIFGACLIGTYRTIRLIKKIKPDIVHLHCPNGYFINIPSVVRYLNINQIPTLITQHCEFFYTGNCGYALDCDKWKNGGCNNCPTLKQSTGSVLLDNTNLSFKRMKDAFDGFENDCYIVSCTPWLNERAGESIILNKFKFGTVYNGTDISNFHYIKDNEIKENYNIAASTKVITYVNPVFSDQTKGGHNLYELAKYFENEDVVFLLVGNNDTSIQLPKNVINVGAINDSKELAKYYSAGDVSLLLSYRECFPMTVVEAVCCGTQVVGFKCGGPDKAYDVSLAEFVEHGNIELLADTIKKHLNNDMLGKEKRAEIAASLYSKEVMANNYIKTYETIIAEKKLGE